ncbi:MAG: filamentous hemagglutinin N-terminal domain-containing protein, partial [Gallionella sp.]|nr:filamentous hemagglutinin N-terminal domain-containing protein [Gallionella sp.]
MNKTSFKKQSVKRTKPQLKPVYAAILLALTTQTAQALPTGAAVVSGQASFATTGNTLTVTNTPGTIINWQGFSIGSTEITRFAQQSASSSVLNRVVSNNPSNILGTLQSNGRVFLINPNGIVFGAGATVDVAGLVASTLNLSNADFLAGRYNFTAVPGAQKLGNAGNIAAQEGGQIYLIAPDVENTGVITAPNGEILLAAGHSVDLVNTNSPNLIVNITAPAGDATNVGQLIASSGRLGLFGTVVRNSGAVSANSATMEGGKIVFKATQRVEAGGTITAQGAGGGRIEVLADMQTGTVDVTGKLDASAPVSGNGGFIETSAAHVQVADSARVTTLAANGANGTWLIDPTDFTIAASGGDITGSVLSTNLVGGNVTIFSTSGTSGTAGDVNVNDTVSWSANLLTLNALNNINVNANLDGSGSASLALEYGQSSSFGSGSNYFLNNGAKINLPQGNTFSTKQGLFGTVINYYVINNLGVAGDISTTSLQGMKNGLSGNYALGADIDATTTSGWNGGLGFEPIGNATYKFTGAFEGLGHTISNLAISRAGTNYVGLFGYAENARIRNIGIVGGSIAGTGFVGGLVGYNSANSGMASISDSYSTAIVEGVTTVGGLVGYNYGLGAGNVSIINSHATGSVSGASGVGGLVGYNRADLSSSANIGNSYATGNVSGNSEVGGLVGFNWANAGGLAGIDYSHASGNISGTANVGGLVGYNDWGGISGSHAGGGSVTVTPTASPANAGGLAG